MNTVQDIVEATLAGDVWWRRDGLVHTADNGLGRTMSFDGHCLVLGGFPVTLRGRERDALQMAVEEAEALAECDIPEGFGDEMMVILAEPETEWGAAADGFGTTFTARPADTDWVVCVRRMEGLIHFHARVDGREFTMRRPEGGAALAVLEAAAAALR